MIRLGLDDEEKRIIIDRVVKERGIRKVYVFHHKKFPPRYGIDGAVSEQIEYSDIIMYKFFYRLLEEIDEKSLIVYDGCLRTKSRSDLTYNCAHHYSNQTPNNLVFEHFPFIDNVDDFMILLDLQAPGKYKGKGFSTDLLQGADVGGMACHITAESLPLPVPLADSDKAAYEQKKTAVFEELRDGDPDVLPRTLHLFAGHFKRSAIRDGLHYVARNARYKNPNVTVYGDVERGDYIVLDFAHRRLDFNDFLRKSGMKQVRFVNTGLPVDEFYMSELNGWIERTEAFYAQAGLR